MWPWQFCPSGLAKNGKCSRIIASLRVVFNCLVFMLSCSGARAQLLEREAWLLAFAPAGSYVLSWTTVQGYGSCRQVNSSWQQNSGEAGSMSMDKSPSRLAMLISSVSLLQQLDFKERASVLWPNLEASSIFPLTSFPLRAAKLLPHACLFVYQSTARGGTRSSAKP